MSCLCRPCASLSTDSIESGVRIRLRESAVQNPLLVDRMLPYKVMFMCVMTPIFMFFIACLQSYDFHKLLMAWAAFYIEGGGRRWCRHCHFC